MCSPTMLQMPPPSTEGFSLILQAVARGANTEPSQRKRRRVRFSSSISSFNADYEEDDVGRLWYCQQDLATFKTEAKQHFLAARASRILFPGESLRGLESSTLERQYWRHRTIQATLSAHKKGMSVNDTAMISRKCTAWNEEIAFVQACHDYCTVYHPEMILPQVPVHPPKFPFELRRATPQEERRRVRRRTL